MRGRVVSLMLGAGLVLAVVQSASAGPLPFTGAIAIRVFAQAPDVFPPRSVPGAGTAQANVGTGFQLLSLTLPSGAFGPLTTSIPKTEIILAASINSIRYTIASNGPGAFSNLSGGPPGGGTMGLSGLAKVCLIFAPCPYAAIPFNLTPSGADGFGLGGTRIFPGGVDMTLQHAPWTLAQPLITIHDSGTNTSTPTLPSGFAHGPATLTSSTAQAGGVLQLVTVTKAFTSIAIPEIPVTGVLTLRFVPEPGSALLLGAGAVLLAVGRSRR